VNKGTKKEEGCKPKKTKTGKKGAHKLTSSSFLRPGRPDEGQRKKGWTFQISFRKSRIAPSNLTPLERYDGEPGGGKKSRGVGWASPSSKLGWGELGCHRSKQQNGLKERQTQLTKDLETMGEKEGETETKEFGNRR